MVRIDQKLIDKFLTRGVDSIYPSRDALKQKLMSGEKIRAYQGFDPTGPYLHIGHAMGIRALRILQELGHEVIFLVGDFTARVGDPDKEKGRQMLSAEQIEKNMAGWKQQASNLIEFEGENPVQFKQNYEWLHKLQFDEILELMSHATVQQMIERDLFQRRLKSNDPIGLQEFVYPLMQAYDNLAMNIDLEIGGTDQIFNMLIGRQIMKAYKNKEKYVRANELMEAPDARTMSKTKGNGINLSDTSENIYGKAMSYPDELITKGLRLLTDVELEDIADIEKQMRNGANPMQFKKLMAFEIVKTIRGKKEAEMAQKHFETTVQNKEADLQNAYVVSISDQKNISEVVKSANISAISTSQIKRVIEQGGLEINGLKVTDPFSTQPLRSGDIIKFGKRTFIKIS